MLAAEIVTQVSNETAADRDSEHKRLIAKVAADRDRGAFEVLFLYFGPRVKALMMRSGADQAMAEDLVQDVMMSVWRKVHLYAPERGSVSTWVFTIARNARIDRLRRSASQPYEDIDELEIPAGDAGADSDVLASQRAERIAEALSELPDEQRRIIELAYVHDKPQSRIAKDLALPLGTVKSRMRLAYGKLREKLGELR